MSKTILNNTKRDAWQWLKQTPAFIGKMIDVVSTKKEGAMSHDDQYKHSFDSYKKAARACKRNQQPYRRLSDGRWCLTHKSRGRLRYNRAEVKRKFEKVVGQYL